MAKRYLHRFYSLADFEESYNDEETPKYYENWVSYTTEDGEAVVDRVDYNKNKKPITVKYGYFRFVSEGRKRIFTLTDSETYDTLDVSLETLVQPYRDEMDHGYGGTLVIVESDFQDGQEISDEEYGELVYACPSNIARVRREASTEDIREAFLHDEEDTSTMYNMSEDKFNESARGKAMLIMWEGMIG